MKNLLENTADMKLKFREDGHLQLLHGEQWALVNPKPCFPWSEPDRYISLRNEKHEELAFIADPQSLDSDSRDALERSLKPGFFTFEITRIHSLHSQFDLRIWDVDTKQGRRSFQVKLDDWPQSFPDGSMVIKDLSGDLFSIARPDSLDKQSQKLLWSFRD